MQVSTLLVAICNAAAPCVALLLCDDCGDSRTRGLGMQLVLLNDPSVAQSVFTITEKAPAY